jgi:hypothetical protein
MVQILWLVLGGTAFVAALFAGRRRRAVYVARAALGALYLGAGALVNAIFLATGGGLFRLRGRRALRGTRRPCLPRKYRPRQAESAPEPIRRPAIGGAHRQEDLRPWRVGILAGMVVVEAWTCRLSCRAPVWVVGLSASVHWIVR